MTVIQKSRLLELTKNQCPLPSSCILAYSCFCIYFQPPCTVDSSTNAPYTGWKLYKRKIGNAISTTLLFGVRVLLGFPVAYLKLWVDAVLHAMANLGCVPQKWTEYDQKMKFLKIESSLGLELQNKIMKLLEQLWEALPQLALATTYYYNNTYYIWFSETSLPFPTTIISMTLSSGSVLVGLISGATAARDFAFITAGKNGREKRMKLLLNLGADPNLDVGYGATTIHLASRQGHVVVVKSLIQAGGEVNSQDERGWTPLHEASESGHLEVVKSLIQAGGEVNSQDERGWTPLHVATLGHQKEVITALLAAGADKTIKSKSGRTPRLSYIWHPPTIGVGTFGALKFASWDNRCPRQ